MSSKPMLWIVALIVVLAAGWYLTPVHGQREEQQKWEYKTVSYGSSDNDSTLNVLGAQGWELASVQQDTRDGYNFRFFLKRRK